MDIPENMVPVMVDGLVIGYLQRPEQPYARFYEFAQDIPPCGPNDLPYIPDRISLTAHYYDEDGFPAMLEGKDASSVSRIPGFQSTEGR